MGVIAAGERQDSRRAFRHKMSIEATLTYDRKTIRVVIKDISRLGARLLGSGSWTKSDEVVLAGDGLQIVATVVWSDHEYCGINFHKAIDPHHVLRNVKYAPMTSSLRLAQQMEGGPTALQVNQSGSDEAETK